VPAAYAKTEYARNPTMSTGRRSTQPHRAGRKPRPSSGDTVVITGRELVSAVNVTSSNIVGDTLLRADIAPQAMIGTRLLLLSSIYEKYQVIFWKCTYVTNVSTSEPGSLVMYFDPDVSDTTTSGINQARRGFSAKGKSFPVYENSSVTFKPEKKQTDLFTSDATDLRISRAGFLAIISNYISAKSQTLGNIYVDYKIRFFKPLLELSAPSYTSASANATSPTISNTMGSGLVMIGTADFVITWVNGNSFSFPAIPGSNYYIFAICSGTVLVSSANPAINSGATSILTGYALDSTDYISYTFCLATASTITWTLHAPTGTTIATTRIVVTRTNTLSAVKDLPAQNAKRIEELESMLSKLSVEISNNKTDDQFDDPFPTKRSNSKTRT